MAIKYTYGNVRSVFFSYAARTGTIRLRTPTGTLTLKISNDVDGTFDAQAAVVSAAAQYGNVTTPELFPHLHVSYEADDPQTKYELSTVEFHWEHVFFNPQNVGDLGQLGPSQ